MDDFRSFWSCVCETLYRRCWSSSYSASLFPLGQTGDLPVCAVFTTAAAIATARGDADGDDSGIESKARARKEL